MRRLTAGLAGLALALTALGAHAQTATPPAAPAAIPVAPGAMSVENTPIADLLADPGAKAVLEKDMPKLVSYPGLDQIKGMTLRGISVYPEAELDDAKLAAIQKDLDAAKK
ncbi:MAG: hypothetical protein JWO83_4397 [Caulobacteraceae bacterium]|jgi:hypothetical protein|nr:hypothetical protein [Caulobacteraceae bacterium]